MMPDFFLLPSRPAHPMPFSDLAGPSLQGSHTQLCGLWTASAFRVLTCPSVASSAPHPGLLTQVPSMGALCWVVVMQ